jgi:signal transduction histidine kinase
MGVFLHNAPIGAIVFDIDRVVINANLKARKMFSMQFNRVGRVTFSHLFADQVSFEKLPTVSADNDQSLHEIIKVNDHFLEINISQMVLEKNMPHYLLLLNDVTEKINSENLLKRKVEELEFLNQELDEFVNVVSHDFKTPLTAISLLAEMALKERSPEKQLDFISKIKQSSGKLKELLKGLTTLVDTKKERSDKVELVDLNERLEVVLSEYKEMLTEIDGEIQSDFSQAPSIAYFTAHIDSFLSNLLTNSIKYRQLDKPLLIEINSRIEKDFTILSVKDNGIGIDLAKNMSKLFKPFKRLTEQSTGSGLGLSLIKRMIEKDQGYLEVFSTPGKGTELKAYLKNQA